MKLRKPVWLIAAAAALLGCDGATNNESTAEAAVSAPQNVAALLDQVLAGDHRTEEERARDAFRHPKETLLFFGAQPDMTVVEVWPGGGWYANILAPFLAAGGGRYYAAGLDPESSDRAAAAVARFGEKFGGNPNLYGDVRITVLESAEGPAPDGGADLVLTFRNVHNWLGRDTAEENFARFYAALKPGGFLGVVEHRADPSASADQEGANGYVREATVIALAEAAGFDFDSASEINANPADTKDHPFGVWTLPPVRRSSAVRGVDDPEFDRSRYDAIGESDRMTLKFRKPLAADGALLE